MTRALLNLATLLSQSSFYHNIMINQSDNYFTPETLTPYQFLITGF